MSSLHSPRVAKILDRLFAEAEREDPPRFERLQRELAQRGEPLDESHVSELLAEVFMPVEPGDAFSIALQGPKSVG
jgi:hypothetical protein